MSKSDLRVTRRQEHRRPVGPDEARLAVQRFGLSANNITYAVMGAAMRYWEFFPVADETDRAHWGRVPVWGFAEVTESRHRDLTPGTRLFGYLPLASELVISPGRFDESGFSDLAEHRQSLPAVYNRLALVSADPEYTPEREAHIMLLRPLFITSFVVDDFLDDHAYFGAERLIISSASAKTALGAAFLAKGRPGLEVVGLTSPAHVDFCRETGCYDRVITYEETDTLDLAPSAYVDVAGRRDVTRAVHERLGELLAYSMIVGDTHWEHVASTPGELVGPRPTLLFAPDQIQKRRRDWGRPRFERAVADAWARFLANVDAWMTLVERTGLTRSRRPTAPCSTGTSTRGSASTADSARSGPSGEDHPEGAGEAGHDRLVVPPEVVAQVVDRLELAQRVRRVQPGLALGPLEPGELGGEVTGHLVPQRLDGLVQLGADHGVARGAVARGALGARHPLIEAHPGLDEAREPLREGSLTDGLDDEQRVDELAVAGHGRAHQPLAVLEVAVDRAGRDAAAGGHLLGARLDVLGEQLDERVEDRLAVAVPTGRPAVDGRRGLRPSHRRTPRTGPS